MRELTEYRTFPLRLPARWNIEEPVVTVQTNDRQTFFAFRQLCTVVKVGFGSQTQVLTEHPEWYPEGSVRRFYVQTDHGRHEMVFLRKAEAAWWLGHLNPSRVGEQVRGRIEELIADLKAAADRLAWGDLSDVARDRALTLYHPPLGTIQLGYCPRCAAPLALRMDEHGGHLEITVEEVQ